MDELSFNVSFYRDHTVWEIKAIYQNLPPSSPLSILNTIEKTLSHLHFAEWNIKVTKITYLREQAFSSWRPVVGPPLRTSQGRVGRILRCVWQGTYPGTASFCVQTMSSSLQTETNSPRLPNSWTTFRKKSTPKFGFTCNLRQIWTRFWRKQLRELGTHDAACLLEEFDLAN